MTQQKNIRMIVRDDGKVLVGGNEYSRDLWDCVPNELYQLGSVVYRIREIKRKLMHGDGVSFFIVKASFEYDCD